MWGKQFNHELNIFGRRKGLFKLTPQGKADIKMKRIFHVKAGVDPDNAATLAYDDVFTCAVSLAQVKRENQWF